MQEETGIDLGISPLALGIKRGIIHPKLSYAPEDLKPKAPLLISTETQPSTEPLKTPELSAQGLIKQAAQRLLDNKVQGIPSADSIDLWEKADPFVSDIQEVIDQTTINPKQRAQYEEACKYLAMGTLIVNLGEQGAVSLPEHFYELDRGKLNRAILAAAVIRQQKERLGHTDIDTEEPTTIHAIGHILTNEDAPVQTGFANDVVLKTLKEMHPHGLRTRIPPEAPRSKVYSYETTVADLLTQIAHTESLSGGVGNLTKPTLPNARRSTIELSTRP